MDERLSYRNHQPIKGARVIVPDKPWESWAVFAYNHVLEVSPSNYRMYYDCIEGDGVPPGSDSISSRRICLATSDDGLSWIKPKLGIFNYNGSTANNILVADSGVSVFHDGSANASEAWKMVCSTAAYSSPDGLRWTKLPFAKVAEDDTKPTAYWDPSLSKYVISLRRDIQVPGKTQGVERQIGRCETTNISNWQEDAPDGCPSVFAPDDQDPDLMDVYTNAWTPYPSIDDPAVHLFFPSMYRHFAHNPFGFGNDGLLDIRLLVSRDGGKSGLRYTPAPNARSPFVPLGVNRCGASSPTAVDGWCSPVSGVEASTSFDTSAMYMASGYLNSLDKQSLYLYSSGQPFTHGGDAANKSWGSNTGIRLLTLRRDGFVSVDAPYRFYPNLTDFPTMTTVELLVPNLRCPAQLNVSLMVNAVTSVVGFIAIEVQQDAKAVPGFGLDSSERLVGNMIVGRASWGTGGSLETLVGQNVSFKLAMADSSLYSLDFACA
eukprot:TRINITY_DN10339_c0_g1_i1.p1 TRINITY_DN10339_c0_g1~~TRINITY_DN10339_c0_g1_i1.p1  ORF type:complete len:490 (-),score=83.31 TRINITY_DN10339_c0_g1_i1:293-1762(-)